MSDSSGSSVGTPRREFLHRIVGAGVAVAGSTLLSGCATAGATASTSPQAAAAPQWDMSWRDKLGIYKTAYDSPEIQSGAALAFAGAAMFGYKSAMNVGEGTFTPVLILRHTASMMVLNDAMWERLGLGESQKLKDGTTGEPAKRNPFMNYAKGDKFTMIGEEGGLDSLMKRGAIVLTCNNALLGIGGMLRRKETTLTQEQARAEVRNAVIPGAYVMPNGIFAVSASQDAGCHYMRVLV